jgi:HD-like signal output (HDOD) protein/ActR/RegA family two-component response regulator
MTLQTATPLSPHSTDRPWLKRGRRVVFVDDDDLVLRSLRRLAALFADPSWDFQFFSNPLEAFEQMGQHQPDIVVSDAQMQPLSGSDFLNRVQNRYPDCVRIVLSGDVDPQTVFRKFPSAHQFLSKPCSTELLENTLAEAGELRDLLTQPELRYLVGSSGELPSAPRVYQELMMELAESTTSAMAVASVIERDVGLSSRILQLVSSSAFGLRYPVTSMGAAVAYLGLDMTRAVVLSLEASSALSPVSVSGFSPDVLAARACATARLSKRIAGSDPLRQSCLFTAAMLKDVGLLLLAGRAPGRLNAVLQLSRSRSIPVAVAMRELLGTDHAVLGAYLLGLWGLPREVVLAVAHHLNPPHRAGRPVSPSTLLHLASALAEDPDTPLVRERASGAAGLDCELMESAGLIRELHQLRQLAAQIQSGD